MDTRTGVGGVTRGGRAGCIALKSALHGDQGAMEKGRGGIRSQEQEQEREHCLGDQHVRQAATQPGTNWRIDAVLAFLRSTTKNGALNRD